MELYGIGMELPWNAMGLPWNAVGLPWDGEETAMASCDCHPTVIASRGCHVTATWLHGTPWDCHGLLSDGMGLPFVFMERPYPHEIALGLPWKVVRGKGTIMGHHRTAIGCYGTAMGSSCVHGPVMEHGTAVELA